MGFRDAGTWIGFSMRKIAKQAIVRNVFIASQVLSCLK